MDPLTHTLTGLVTAEAFLKKKLGRETVPLMAVAANLPDVDVLMHFTADPAAITWRRSFGHSVFAFPLWAALLATFAKWRWPHFKWWTLYGLCLLGSCLHVFFDLVNSFGVLALWPFSDYRPELAILFIIDLALTGILAAPYLAYLNKSWQPHARRVFRVSAACAGVYVLFCAGNRLRAELLLSPQQLISGAKEDFSYVFPEPLGAHRWRGVVRHGSLYRIYLIETLSGRVELKKEVATQESPEIAAAKESPIGRRLAGFFKAPVWQVVDGPEGRQVRAWDLRFRSLTIDRAGIFEFVFAAGPSGIEPVGWAGRDGRFAKNG